MDQGEEAMAGQKKGKGSIHARLGGAKAIRAALVLLYERILADS
ncbi:MAG: hypothetical protein ACI8W3_000428, partial [Myxococcota bacterium]